MKFSFIKIKQDGFIFLSVMIISTFILLAIGGVLGLSLMQKKLYAQQIAMSQALHMAEAGVNYYYWHLLSNPNDYYDGTGSDPGDPGVPYGPYEHSYAMFEGGFSLEIFPPEAGSSEVVIRSTGWANSHPNTKKIIEAKYGRQ
jgi:hypothetical protein